MNKASFDSLVDQAHDLIVQIPSLFSQPGQVEQAREVALACHKHMLELGDQNRAEAAYERQQERDLEFPPASAREEQLRTWDEHQKLHRR